MIHDYVSVINFIIIIFNALVLHSQGLKISKCKNCMSGMVTIIQMSMMQNF